VIITAGVYLVTGFLGYFAHTRALVRYPDEDAAAPGNIELSPADAAWLFHWMEPEIPAGWHAVTDKPKGDGVPIVNVRK
jgi:hypothetical protein